MGVADTIFGAALFVRSSAIPVGAAFEEFQRAAEGRIVRDRVLIGTRSTPDLPAPIGPAFRDQQFSFVRGQIENVARTVGRHVDTVEPGRELSGQSHTHKLCSRVAVDRRLPRDVPPV